MVKDCRILLKRTDTGLFYQAPNNWVVHRQDASAFENSMRAIYFCKEHNFKDIVILMDFGKSEYDVILNIG